MIVTTTSGNVTATVSASSSASFSATSPTQQLSFYQTNRTPTLPPVQHDTFVHPRVKGAENLLILPNQIKDMYITKITIIPSSVVLLVSSIILCFTILVYFKRVLKIYLGLLFYAITELILFMQILVFYFLTTGNYMEKLSCGVTKSIGLFTIVLPVLAILLITLCRLIFVKYPLQYRDILRIKYQVVFFVAAVVFCLLLSLPPTLGVCEAVYIPQYRICQFLAGGMCTCYISVYVTFGIAAPTGIVVGIYIFVYNILRKHRARRSSFAQHQLRGSSASRAEKNANMDKTFQHSSTFNSSDLSGSKATLRRAEDVPLHDRDGEGAERLFRIPEIKITDFSQPITARYLCHVTDTSQSQPENVTTTDILIVNELALQIDTTTDKNNISVLNTTNLSITTTTRTDSHSDTTSAGAPSANHSTVYMSRDQPLANHSTVYMSRDTGKPGISPTASSAHFICDSAANLLSPKYLKESEVKKESVQFTEIKDYLRDTVRRFSKSSKRESDMLFMRRKEVPWSLVLLTLIHILSSVPWIFIEFYSHLFFEATPNELVFLDIVNAVLAISVCISPLLYIIFTRLIRDKVRCGLLKTAAAVKDVCGKCVSYRRE